MARKWTAEQRAKQSELIRCWKPWEHSTGAKTPEGKAKASRNAYKGGEAGKAIRLVQAWQELIFAWTRVKKLGGEIGELPNKLI